MKDIKHIRQDFHSERLGHAPGGLRSDVGQKFNFLDIIMLHIKLKEMISRPGYTVQFYTYRINYWKRQLKLTIRGAKLL